MRVNGPVFDSTYPVTVLFTTEMAEDVVVGDSVAAYDGTFRKREPIEDTSPLYRGIMIKDAVAGQAVTLYSNGAVTYD